MTDYRLWRTLDGHTYIINFIAFSTTGELLATGGGFKRCLHHWSSKFVADDGGSVSIWTLVTGNLFQKLPRHPSGSEAVSCCWGDDKELFVGYGDGEVHFYEHCRLQNRFERSFSVQTGPEKHHVASLAMHSGLLICSSGNRVYCWRMEKPVYWPHPYTKGNGKRRFPRGLRSVSHIPQHFGGRSGSFEAIVAAQVEASHSYSHPVMHSGESALSSNGKFLSVTNLAAAVLVYEILPVGLRLLHEYPSPTDTSNNFPLQTCFVESQAVVVAGSDNGEVRLWELDSGKHQLLLHDASSLVFHTPLFSQWLCTWCQASYRQNMAACIQATAKAAADVRNWWNSGSPSFNSGA
ncbi:WD40 repeat-like protein [Auricularia subglabra TFB-10046 SS5]|nr:WD40 repeat-like protein [Auricularia subglabra TFB-10046 SS5]